MARVQRPMRTLRQCKCGIEPSVKAVVGGTACADAVVGVRADLRDVGGSVSGNTGSEQPCQR